MELEVKEAYTWGVLYTDGEYQAEYDIPDGYAWKDLKEKPIKEIWLQRPGEGEQYGNQVRVPEHASPVFFRRRFITIRIDGENALRTTVHCIGWKREEQEVYLFVFENGSSLLTTDFQAI